MCDNIVPSFKLNPEGWSEISFHQCVFHSGCKLLWFFTNSAVFCCWVVLYERCPKMLQGLIFWFYRESHVSQMSSRKGLWGRIHLSFSLPLFYFIHQSALHHPESLSRRSCYLQGPENWRKTCFCSRGWPLENSSIIAGYTLKECGIHLTFNANLAYSVESTHYNQND